jgi:phage baseplate assembly protein W
MDIKFLGSLVNSEFAGTRNDITFTDANDIQLATGRDYAKQKIVKVILATVGSDYYFPFYGTELANLTFKDILDPTIQNAVVNTILGALTYIEEQETSTNLSELLSSVDNIELVPDVVNQTIYVRMIITLQDNKQVQLAVGGQ